MPAPYRCQQEKRREAIRGRADLNGIDYLEVLDRDAPSEAERQRKLLVYFVNPLAEDLAPANLRIEGGERIRDIAVLEAQRGAGPQAHLLTVTVDKPGDFSLYTLRLVSGPGSDLPPPGFDRILSSVEFSFKVECPSEFDCARQEPCSARALSEPVIDYLAKDYTSFRRLMLDRLALTLPEWEERSPADVGIALVEALAYAADHLSYYQDAVATEAYLGTARRRTSLRRHARLLDYRMHEGSNARAWVHIRVDGPHISLKAGTQLFTRVAGYPSAIPPDSRAYEEVLREQPEVFETMHQAELYESHNSIHFHTWGDEECRLPKGATRATLVNQDLGLKLAPGDLLLLEEVRSPATGLAADADPAHRHVVRLSAVTPDTDPVGNVPVLEVEWAAADALPFCLCVSAIVPQADDTERVQPASVARGNLVLADHGRTVRDEPLPAPESSGRRPYRPQLKLGGVTHRAPFDPDVAASQPAAAAIWQDPVEALPCAELRRGAERWTPRRDLLSSGRFDRHFVLEVENDGSARLRFGDGVLGLLPGSGLSGDYRVGNGKAGNVGAEAIYHVVTADPGVVAARNPLPAQGGVDPETLTEVRLYAPQAFRTQERAVIEKDYASAAERYPEVQRAAATLRCTGSWYTVFITVDRKGGLPVDSAFETRLRAFLERFRLAGYDLEIDAPLFVPLDIAFEVTVAPGHQRSTLEEELLGLFSSRELSGGRRGLFHPDNLTFGGAIYLSRLVAEAMRLPGVAWVNPVRFQRYGQAPRGELDDGRIVLGRLEIARLDNDPNRPENGRISFDMKGGL